jgi:sugar transferase (PEP-CTERM/EpsH1 system associated)
MNVLIFTPYLPYPLNNGGLIRVHHLVVNIARSHNVTLLCLEPDNDAQAAGIEVLRAQGVTVELAPADRGQLKQYKRMYQLASLFSSKTYEYYKYHSKALQNRIDELCQAEHFDLILTEFSQMGYYQLPDNIEKYVDQHNVEYEIMQRTFETERSPLRKFLAKAEWRKYYHHEIENCEKFDACLTTSQRDADILKSRMSSDTQFHVIPNGVDSEFFQPATDTANPNLILFTGTISYYPNVEGILWFAKSVWPIIKQKKPDAQFCIAGKAPPAEVQALASDPDIEVTGAVDDMRDYYAKAAVVVVPLRVGGGTRLKILEAMAMGKAIVSTAVGAEGINYTKEQDILIEDEPNTFADATIRVMSDGTLRDTLESQGRALVEKQYDWRAVTEQLCRIFENSAAATKAPGNANHDATTRVTASNIKKAS